MSSVADAIEFAKQSGSDCGNLVTFVALQETGMLDRSRLRRRADRNRETIYEPGKRMTPEHQRTVIGQKHGWAYRKTVNGIPYGRAPEGQHPKLFGNEVPWDIPFPDYLNDLNTMHEAVMDVIVHGKEIEQYRSNEDLFGEEVRKISEREQVPVWHFSAQLYAEAFLRTLNLWKD